MWPALLSFALSIGSAVVSSRADNKQRSKIATMAAERQDAVTRARLVDEAREKARLRADTRVARAKQVNSMVTAGLSAQLGSVAINTGRSSSSELSGNEDLLEQRSSLAGEADAITQRQIAAGADSSFATDVATAGIQGVAGLADAYDFSKGVWS